MQPSKISKIVVSLASVAFVIIVTLILLVSLKQHQRLTNPDAARKSGQPIPVVVAPVAIRELTALRGAECVSKPAAQIVVSSTASTTVTDIKVNVGDSVKAGDTLVMLKSDTLKKFLNNALQAQENAARHAAFMESHLQDLLVLQKKNLLPIVELLRAKEDIALANRVLAQANRDVIQYTEMLKDTTVLSPINGEIAEILLTEGAIPRLSEALMKINQVSPMMLACDFVEHHIPVFSEKDQYEFSFFYQPENSLDVEFNRLLPPNPANSTPGKDYMVTALFEIVGEHTPPARVGMHGNLIIKTQVSGLTVASTGLLNIADNTAEVFVVAADNTVVLRKLSLGDYANGYYAVKSGLTAGEKVVVIGQLYLKPGDAVNIQSTQQLQ